MTQAYVQVQFHELPGAALAAFDDRGLSAGQAFVLLRPILTHTRQEEVVDVAVAMLVHVILGHGRQVCQQRKPVAFVVPAIMP